MYKLFIALLVGVVGTYIDLIIDAIFFLASWINWNLLIVLAVSLAILSPFIHERLKEIKNIK
jgi:hypothetical protein